MTTDLRTHSASTLALFEDLTHGIDTDLGPISQDWTTTGEHPDATAYQLTQALAAYETGQLISIRADLSAAVDEFVINAGLPWPDSAGNPVVVLVRSIARLSRVAPDATSAAAAQLIERLTPDL